MKCKVDYCQRVVNRSGKGYCRRHYDQIRKYGHVLDERTNADPNEFEVETGCVVIVLRDQYSNETGRAIVDLNDYDLVIKYKWSLNDNGYVRTFINTKPLYLHRYLLGLTSEDLEVDHINGNKSDNRRINLRTCEHWVNSANRDKSRAKVLGVVNTKRNLAKPFVARIVRKKKRHELGYYATQEEAIVARLQAEMELDTMYNI